MLPKSDAVHTTKYRWYVLGLLTLAHTCHVIDRMVVSVVMEPIRHEFDLTDTQLGLVSSLGYGIAYGLAVIPVGVLVDRHARKTVLSIILAVWSALTIVCGFANSWITLLISRTAVGAAEAGGSPAGLSILSDYFAPRERSTAVGLWYLASAMGTIFTFLGGSLVAAEYGWRAAFFLAGAPGLLLAVLVYTTIREPKRGGSDKIHAEPEHSAVESLGDMADAGAPSVPAEPDPPRLSTMESLKVVGARPAVVHLLLGVLLTAAAISSYATWSISFLVRQHDLGLAEAGVTIGITIGVLGAIGGALFGMIADRATRKDANGNPWRSGLIAAGTSVFALGFGLASLLVETTMIALILVAFYAFLFTSYNGPANGMLLTITPSNVRGFTVALLQLGATLIGYGVAPFLVGGLSDLIGGDNSLGYALSLMLLCHPLAALHFALAGRHVRRAGANDPSLVLAAQT